MRSLELVADREPRFLALTHFGFVSDPQAHIERTKEALQEMAELAREVLAEHGDTDAARQAFVAEVNRRAEARSDPETAAGLGRGSPVEQRWMGLRRYWQKQAQAA